MDKKQLINDLLEIHRDYMNDYDILTNIEDDEGLEKVYIKAIIRTQKRLIKEHKKKLDVIIKQLLK
jgi:hypothetical protein